MPSCAYHLYSKDWLNTEKKHMGKKYALIKQNDMCLLWVFPYRLEWYNENCVGSWYANTCVTFQTSVGGENKHNYSPSHGTPAHIFVVFFSGYIYIT